MDDIDYNRFALSQVITLIFDLECVEASNG